MRVGEEGHIFVLNELPVEPGGEAGTQTLKFIRRSSGQIKHPTEWPGVQTQEVLRALIKRTIYLNHLIPCNESMNAIWHLRMTLWEYEARAYRRKMSTTNRTEGQHPEGSEPKIHRAGIVSCQIADDIPFGIEGIWIYEANNKQKRFYDGIENVPVGPDGHLDFDWPIS